MQELPEEIAAEILRRLDYKSRLALSSTCGTFLRALEFPRLWYYVNWQEKKLPPRFLALIARKGEFIHRISCCALKETSIWSLHFNRSLASMVNLVHVNLAFCMVLYDMDWLENCPKIKNLIVTSCPNMSSMSFVRGTKTLQDLVYLECMNNGHRIISLQIVDIASSCTKLTHLNCYGMENMRYWMADEILSTCPDMQVFNLSSNHIFDDSIDAMGWYKITKRKYSHVLFSRNILHKVEEYMDIDREVSYEAWLDFKARQA